MRYRPFAQSGVAISTLCMVLDGARTDRVAESWRDLAHAAFEQGINAFEVRRPTDALLAGFAVAVEAVRRQLLFVALRLDPDLEARQVAAWTQGAVERARIGELNLLVADAEAGDDMAAAMRALKDGGLCHRVGLAGGSERLAEPVRDGVCDAVVAPFNLLSGWTDRNLVRLALEQQMGVIACDPCPDRLDELVEAGENHAKHGLFHRAHQPLAAAGTYAFLRTTPGWSEEQICLAYALTEPALASVEVEADDAEHLAHLAEAADRDLPSAVSAQIEMARFSAEKTAAARG
ncbi:MAG: hypothetical protein ACREEW_14510 [Caulobacteraceae bacterium]